MENEGQREEVEGEKACGRRRTGQVGDGWGCREERGHQLAKLLILHHLWVDTLVDKKKRENVSAFNYYCQDSLKWHIQQAFSTMLKWRRVSELTWHPSNLKMERMRFSAPLKSPAQICKPQIKSLFCNKAWTHLNSDLRFSHFCPFKI